MQKHLSATDFSSVYSDRNPNTGWNSFKSILTDIYNKHAPMISKRVKGKISPWINSHIKAEMNNRDKLYRIFKNSRSESEFEKYKSQRNRVNVMVRKAKKEYFRNLLRQSTHDPSRFWKTLKTIFPTKSVVSSAKSFLIDGSLTTCSIKIASSFCNFFTNMASVVKQKAIHLKNFVWSRPVQPTSKTYSTFQFKEVSVKEVTKYLKNLSRKKATGHDNLPPGMLKDSARFIAGPLTYLINLSIQTSIVPEDFKYAIVSPVFKSGSKSDLDNYRLVSVLPICSKVFEKCIHSQVSDFLEEKKVLSATQFGFRKTRNTEIAATLFLDEIRKNTDDGKLTGAIFVDLSKAFDTLSHSKIIENLPSYGIRGKEKELFTNYLFNRKQAVRFGSHFSASCNVTCGVPQGSILGPLLFLLTFNDIESVLTHSQIITYADNNVLYVPGKSIERIEECLCEDFKAVVSWLESMDLVCNMKKGKTEAMLFGTSQKIKRHNLKFLHRYNELPTTSTYKYLGVKLDQTLSIREHIDSSYKKASGRLNLLNRVRPHLTLEGAIQLYQSMIVPVFTYCSILTSMYTRTFEDKVKSFEKRAARTIYNSEVVNWKKISIRRLQQRRLCLQVLNCINGNVCDNFKGYFEIMENNTRNKGKLLRLPYVKLESSKKSFRFNGAKEFNSLPLKLRDTLSVQDFKIYFNNIFKLH